jgi:glycosyltransferase involved in cell wall biosynthesis
MISVVVPVYNEEEVVVATLNDIVAALDGFVEYEIILVNDGSTDSSLEKVQTAGIKNLSIINHIENLGYGKSLYDGILLAKHDCVAIIDGDGSYPASSIRELYKYYPQYDMVVGARRGKEYTKGTFKRWARYLFKYLAEYASGKKVPDINSGLRIFRKDIVINYQDSLCTGFSFTTTITLIFLLNHYFVKYIPIDYFRRKGESKVKPFKDTLRAGQIILEAILYYNPIKLFLLFATCNAGLGLFLWVINYLFLTSPVLTVASAILMASFVPIFCLGMLADQLKKIYKLRRNESH